MTFTINVAEEVPRVLLNAPEKGSNPRIWKVSAKLIAMLHNLPRERQRVFGDGPINSMKTTFIEMRRRLAAKLQNSGLLKISFHTFRHWKATMEYYKTRDILHVMDLLGHKNIRSTLIYTQLIKFEKEDEFYSSTAKTTEEAKKLREDGFEYVCTTPEDTVLFRKRK